MAFVQHGGVPGGLPGREMDPDLDAELARDLGLCHPWSYGPKAGHCPGSLSTATG